MATMTCGLPLEALLLTSIQQKKIVQREERRDFALFALHIAVVKRQHSGFVSNSLLFTLWSTVTVLTIAAHRGPI